MQITVPSVSTTKILSPARTGEPKNRRPEHQARDIERTTDRSHRKDGQRPVFLAGLWIESKQALGLRIAEQLILPRLVLSHGGDGVRRGVDLAVGPPANFAGALLDSHDKGFFRQRQSGKF